MRDCLPVLLPLEEVSLDEPFSHDESVCDSFLEASLVVRTDVPLLEARLADNSDDDEVERVALAGELFLGEDLTKVSFLSTTVLSFLWRGEATTGVFLRELIFEQAGSSGIWGCLSSEDEAVLDLRLWSGITSMLPCEIMKRSVGNRSQNMVLEIHITSKIPKLWLQNNATVLASKITNQVPSPMKKNNLISLLYKTKEKIVTTIKNKSYTTGIISYTNKQTQINSQVIYQS